MNNNWIWKIQDWFYYRWHCRHSSTISTWVNCGQGFLQLSIMMSHSEVSQKSKYPQKFSKETQIKMHVRSYLFSAAEMKIGRCSRGRHRVRSSHGDRSKSSGRIIFSTRSRCGMEGDRTEPFGKSRTIADDLRALYRFCNLFSNSQSQTLHMVCLISNILNSDSQKNYQTQLP